MTTGQPSALRRLTERFTRSAHELEAAELRHESSVLDGVIHIGDAPQRTTVTAVASALQKSGAIGYKRGRITVLSRPALERASCECYATAQKRTRAALRPV